MKDLPPPKTLSSDLLQAGFPVIFIFILVFFLSFYLSYFSSMSLPPTFDPSSFHFSLVFPLSMRIEYASASRSHLPTHQNPRTATRTHTPLPRPPFCLGIDQNKRLLPMAPLTAHDPAQLLVLNLWSIGVFVLSSIGAPGLDFTDMILDQYSSISRIPSGLSLDVPNGFYDNDAIKTGYYSFGVETYFATVGGTQEGPSYLMKVEPVEKGLLRWHVLSNGKLQTKHCTQKIKQTPSSTYLPSSS